MRVPIGPSIQFAMLLADGFAEVATHTLRAAWDRWLGPHRFDRRLGQLTRAGWVEIGPQGGNVERVVRLTEAGRLQALGGRDPELCWRRPWDGRWRVALFDVPEVRESLRKKLRRQLHALHFGYLQNSAWISPDPLMALRNKIRDTAVDVETLTFLEARPGGGESDAQLVAGAWDFPRINRAYDNHAEILRMAPAHWHGASQRRRWLEIEWRAWSTAVKLDPLLPEILLPPNYRGRTACLRRREQLTKVLDLA
jgi:DNA-binding transcriptional regulator PaaX